MPVIFDEVVGNVEPEPEPRPQDDAAAPPGSRVPELDSLQQLLRRLHQRQARLHAD